MNNIHLLVALPSIAFFSCTSRPSEPNQLTPQEMNEGWVLLFDGKTTQGWHVYLEGDVPSVWSVSNGALNCDPSAKDVAFGDLVSNQSYRNFDLSFEWKITRGGNSGVFFNVREDTAYPTAWTTGPEYQLLDNANVTDHNKGDPKRQAGCLFGLTELKNNAQPRPFGEWNQSRIRQQDGIVTFWLNGTESASEDLNSERWQTLVAGSSLGKFPAFGKATSGKIALQNWAKGVSFRNIKIRDLGQ